MRFSLIRKIIALAAAYAVALHALLPPLALAAADAGTLAVICATERSGPSQHNGASSPGPWGACGIACASACASAGLKPDQAAVVFRLADAMSADMGFGRDRDVRPPGLARIFQARAPPA